MTDDEIPKVCLIDDVVRILRTSRRTVQRLRRAGTFPIPELPSLDKRARWSGDAIRKFLAAGTTGGFSIRRRAS